MKSEPNPTIDLRIAASWCFPFEKSQPKETLAISSLLRQNTSILRSETAFGTENAAGINFYPGPSRNTFSDPRAKPMTDDQRKIYGSSPSASEEVLINREYKEAIESGNMKMRARRKRLTWMVLTVILVVVATGAIVGGIVTRLIGIA